MWIAGHEHNYQRFSKEGEGELSPPVYIVTGGGGAELGKRRPCERLPQEPAGTTWHVKFEEKYHYVRLVIYQDRIEVRVFGSDYKKKLPWFWKDTLELEEIDSFVILIPG